MRLMLVVSILSILVPTSAYGDVAVYSNINGLVAGRWDAHNDALWDDITLEGGGWLSEISFYATGSAIVTIPQSPSGWIELRRFDNPNGGPIGTRIARFPFSFPTVMIDVTSRELLTVSDLEFFQITLPYNQRISIGVQFSQPGLALMFQSTPSIGASDDIAWQGIGDNPPPISASEYKAFAFEVLVLPAPPTAALLVTTLMISRQRRSQPAN